jgi:transposase
MAERRKKERNGLMGERCGKVCDMEEAAKYEDLTREDLIKIILNQGQVIAALKKELEDVRKAHVPKNSSNSSIPPSQERVPRTRSLRKKSGKKSGGQPGHEGHHRAWNPNPDKMVVIEDEHCAACGASLMQIEGTVGKHVQEVDLPTITPITIEYEQRIKICVCGHCNCPELPVDGHVSIGPGMSALMTYLNVAHAFPYDRLSQVSKDLLGFAISEGTIANKLRKMKSKIKEVVEKIKQHVIRAAWMGSDETGTHVAGKLWWEWVWQCPEASYFVIEPSRGYRVVKEHFTEDYQGVICHDNWSAQNNTKAGAHQLCHAHLLRKLQYAIDKEKSVYAAQMQQLLRESQKDREKIWSVDVSEHTRQEVIESYSKQLETLNRVLLTQPEEGKLQKCFRKLKDWIFTFMAYPDVPADNNRSEQAIRAAKVKEKISGGFRSPAGATRFADLLSLIHTLRKQHLPLLDSLVTVFQGGEILSHFSSP